MKKIVVQVTIHSEKCKSLIMTIIAKLEGIKSMDMDMEKSTLTVVGTVDPVCIVNALRRKKWCAQIVTVEPEKKEEKKDDKKDEDKCKKIKECKKLLAEQCCPPPPCGPPPPPCGPPPPPCGPPPPYVACARNVMLYEDPTGCIIM